MAKIVFKRKLYTKMLLWKAENNGSTALLIKGARRVGKSTLAEEFAKNEYKTYIKIDFANVSPNISDLFHDLSDLDFFFFQLQTLCNKSLEKRKSVIIFDEVQLQPKARQAIKYLVADGRYDYIETGSLLSIKKNVKGIVIPSEETRLTLYPLDYEEFRWALGDFSSVEFMRQAFTKKMSFGDAVNRKLMRDFRLYMIVGGMPQAVEKYLSSNDLQKVDDIKRNIIELYDDDFRKIDPTGKTSLMFKSIPAELSRNVLRYSVSNAIERARLARSYEAISEMQDSMTVNIAYHANDPSVGMALHKDISRYKLYLCDTGLFITLAFLDKEFTENSLYTKLLNDKLSADLGYVYENVIAQILRTSGNELFYYTFRQKLSNHYYEIDFLISRGDKICPIEVKSSGYKTHASLDAFSQKYSSRINQKYLLYTKDTRKDADLLCLPVYMSQFL